MALTKVTGDFIKDGVLTQAHLHTSHGITTAHIGEGSNLYFTNARVDSRIGDLSTSNLSEGTNLYYTDARVGSYLTTNSYATQSYVNTQVSNLVDSAPSTLDTLNELAAALGDDANFSTTVTNSIATKLPLAGGTLTGALQAQSWLFRSMANQTEYHVLDNGSLNGPSWKFRYDGATANRYVDFGYKDGNGTYYAGLKLYNNSTISWKGTDIINASSQWVGGIASSGYNNTNWDAAYTYSQVGHLPLSGGTLTGNLTISGSNTLEVFGFLYTRSTLRVLNAAGNGWHNWATRSNGKYNLNVNDIAAAAITASGNVTGANLNISNWDTAYGWGDHASAGYLASSSYTAADVLSKILTVDGPGSGLNADLLDGIGGDGYLRSNATDTASGALTFTNSNNYHNGHIYYTAYSANGEHYRHFKDGSNGNGVAINWRLFTGNSYSSTTHIWDTTKARFVTRVESSIDMRTPIYYDIDNTTYYFNGADTSVSAQVAGPIVSAGPTSGTTAANRAFQVNTTTKGALHSTAASGGTGSSADTAPLVTFTGNSTTIQGGIYVSQNSSTGTTLGFFTTDSYAAGPKQSLTIEDTGNVYVNRGYIQASTSIRGPVFYDTNSTTYYLDPANSGTSLYMNGKIIGNASQERVKYSVWNSYTYGIGMKNGFSYGHIASGEYAMTFQMNNNNGRGFWWGDDNHSDAQGAMSLTTNGRLTVATSLSVGQGESITSPDTTTLFVNGTGRLQNIVVGDGTPDTTPAGTTFSNTIKSTGGSTRVVNFEGASNTVSTWYTSGNTALGAIDQDASRMSFWQNLGSGWARQFSIFKGYQQSENQLRAPIFYDSDDTSYYVDSNGTSIMHKLNVNRHNTTGTGAPSYGDGAIEIITSSNGVPAIGFHRGGYSATTLYEYDGELYANAWTTRAQTGKLLSSGNWSSYVFNGSWNGSNFPGSRWGGFSVNTGEIAFQRDNPSSGKMSVMVDGNFYAGENGGFWSLYSGNSYNTKIGWVSNSGGDFAVDGGTRNLKQLNAIYDNNTTFYLDLDSVSQVYRIKDDHGNEMYTRKHSGSDFVNGTLVETDITSNTQHGASFVLEATGKSYSSDPPFSFMVQGYLYNYTIINHSGVHYGKPGFATMKVFDYNGKLAFWWPRVSYWNSFDVHVRDAGGDTHNLVTGISNSTEPSSSKKVSVTMRASSIYGYNPGTSYATNAYAQVYYDTDNTVYKLDPHSTSVLNTVHFGNNTNNGFVSGYGTYSLNIGRVAQMSLDWNSNYNSPSNHGIMSTDSNANFSDSVSINSFNDITLRLDTNNNNANSQIRITDNVSSGTSSNLLHLDTAGVMTVGRSGLSTGQIRILYNDSGSGAGWDTGIYIGRTDDHPNGASYPTYTAAGGYGIQFQANSDGVFYGMKQYTSGNYRPYINWGDDTSDSPMEIAYNGSTKYSFTYDGSFTAVGNLAANGGYLYLSSGNSIFSPSGGVIQTASNFYAERFYDYVNTTYYLDVDTGSYINSLHTAGNIQAGSSGTGNIYLGGTSGNHFRFHTNNSQTYFDMNCSTINWRQGSSTRYYFYPSTANMTINGTLTQYSDIRYKTNIVEIPDAIDKVKSIRGVYYNRTDFNTEPTKIGVIAQEVEVLMPELILQAEDTDLKSVSYNELTAVLVQAIKEQQTIIDDLKSRIETLENQ